VPWAASWFSSPSRQGLSVIPAFLYGFSEQQVRKCVLDVMLERTLASSA
jgi:hypothetical protein